LYVLVQSLVEKPVAACTSIFVIYIVLHGPNGLTSLIQEIGTMLAPNTWPCGTILAVCLLTFSGTQASAADEVIDLKPGFATVVTVERPVGTAIVGNPEVADISVRAGDKKVVVTAKKAIGATNLIILDVDDKEMFNAEINVAGNLSGSTRGAVHVQPTVNRHALHNFQAYYCPPVAASVSASMIRMQTLASSRWSARPSRRLALQIPTFRQA